VIKTLLSSLSSNVFVFRPIPPNLSSSFPTLIRKALHPFSLQKNPTDADDSDRLYRLTPPLPLPLLLLLLLH